MLIDYQTQVYYNFNRKVNYIYTYIMYVYKFYLLYIYIWKGKNCRYTTTYIIIFEMKSVTSIFLL